MLAAVIAAVSAGGADARKKKEEPPPPVQQAPAPAPSPKPVIRDVDTRAKELMDLDAESVRARYGQPRLLRKESPAQVWQYADDTCVLLLVLYEPKDGKGSPRVKYAQGRMLPGRETEAANCLTGPRPATPANASALPPASPVVIPGRPLSGTPIYSPGDPVPAGAAPK